MQKILFIHQTRDDAIGKVDTAQIDELQKYHSRQVDFLAIHPKGNTIF